MQSQRASPGCPLPAERRQSAGEVGGQAEKLGQDQEYEFQSVMDLQAAVDPFEVGMHGVG
jgi:hypothetical protein